MTGMRRPIQPVIFLPTSRRGGSIGGGIAPPGAPTIGTATAGNAQATVTFTAPGSTGGGPITGYRVTSSPGGITATGAASPITITGLTNGTAYTFTVAAQNAGGYGPESAASNSVTPASNLVSNGDFASDTVWTKGAGWTIGGGVASYSNTGSPAEMTQVVAATPTVTYNVTWTLTRTAGTFFVRIIGDTVVNGTFRSVSGTYVETIVCPAGATITLAVRGDGAGVGTVDNVSMVPA